MKKRNIKRTLEIILFFVILYAGAAAFFSFSGICPRVLKTNMALEKNAEINPEEPVIVNFSHKVFLVSRNNEVRVSPDDGFSLNWQDGNRKLVIMPKKFWKPETGYRIIFPGGTSYALIGIAKTELNFSTVKYPEVANFYPADGATDVILGIEDPLTANFSKSTKGFFVKFELNPDPDLAFDINPEKTQFKLMPKEKLSDGQKYEVKISVKYAKDTDAGYREIFRSSFETAPPAPLNWEKDFTLRLDQARIYTKAKITTGKYIDINLSQQILSTFENGKLLDSYLISSGKAAMPTPPGNYKIENKTPRAWSKEYGLYMPYWNALVPDGKFGIHELPEWPGGYKEGANHLGTPVSHGCVRLGVGPAKIVYDWADIGTPVIIY
jgi:lipoprotein-anchoring transpeptidase ErfK/SrfK